MKKLNIGFLGAGYIAGVHAKCLAAVPDVQIAAVCALPKEDAAKFGQTYAGGAAAAYDNFDAMLEKSKLDVLYVCLPPFAHNGQVEKAAERGLHLFLEKPIALTRERGTVMVKAVEKAGVVSQVGYHMRFSPLVAKLKKMIEDGSAGRPTLFEGRFFCNSLHSPWWRDVNRSGGQVFEQCIHIYDLALHLLGDVTLAAGFMDNLCHRQAEGYTVEDTSISNLRFKSGAMGSICGSNCAVPMTWEGAFNVVCEKITARFASVGEAEFIHTGGPEPRRETLKSDENFYLLETRNFLDAVRSKGKTVAPIRDGLKGLTLVSSVIESAQDNGKPVAIR